MLHEISTIFKNCILIYSNLKIKRFVKKSTVWNLPCSFSTFHIIKLLFFDDFSVMLLGNCPFLSTIPSKQLYIQQTVENFSCFHALMFCCSVQFSCSVVSESLRPHGLQHIGPPCPSPTLGASSNSCRSSLWCHPTYHPLSSPSPPALYLSQHQGLFQWVSSSHQVAKVLEFQLQHQSFQWTPRTDLL